MYEHMGAIFRQTPGLQGRARAQRSEASGARRGQRSEQKHDASLALSSAGIPGMFKRLQKRPGSARRPCSTSSGRLRAAAARAQQPSDDAKLRIDLVRQCCGCDTHINTTKPCTLGGGGCTHTTLSLHCLGRCFPPYPTTESDPSWAKSGQHWPGLGRRRPDVGQI